MAASSDWRVRRAVPERDAARCLEIYAPFVEHTTVSFEEIVPSASEFADRIRAIITSHAWLVIERDGEVGGYAYACTHRTRAAYRWAVDVTVYVDPTHQRSGLGRRLYSALFDQLRPQGFHIACAGINLPNDASVGLHEAMGFEPVGVYRRIGWKHGSWRDVGWWQLELLPTTDHPPAEPHRA